jgi:hypothetical protein
MIRVDVHPRLVRTVVKLGQSVVTQTEEKLRQVSDQFGDPHRHGGLGLRKLGRRSYEVRLDRDLRIVFIQEPDRLTAYDVMNHDQVRKWLRSRGGD